MKDFFDKFGSLNGAKYIGIKGYMNRYGEIADVRVNVNISSFEAKSKDVDSLKAVTQADLVTISEEENYPLDVMEKALANLIARGEKNISEKKEDRTNQSIAQDDAYIYLTKGVKMHKETMIVFVVGLMKDKNVRVDGVYPEKGEDTRRILTKCQDAIKKHCDLRMLKFREYEVGQMDAIKISGDTLQML